MGNIPSLTNTPGTNKAPNPPLVPAVTGASAPGRMRKRAQRGVQTEFRVRFVDKKTQIPMIPLDATKYPMWGVYSPSGILMDSGVMAQYGEPGQYRVLWTVPVTAELSSDKGSWLFMYTFVNDKRKQFQDTMDFDVIDKQKTTSGNTDLIEIGVEGVPYRAIWRGDSEPYELSLQIFMSNYAETSQLAPQWQPLPKTELVQAIDGNSLLYYKDIPACAFKRPGSYTVLWTFRETISSPQSIQYGQYRVIRRRYLQFLPTLRFSVERLPLAPDAPQKLTDSDLMEGLISGVRELNSYHPISQYSIDSLPPMLYNPWLLCSMRWLFQSQYLTLGAMSFQFSGGTTNLDFDQTGIMDSAIGRIDTWLGERMTPAKIAANRLLTSNAALGLRASRPYGLNSRVIRYESDVGSGNESMMMATLSTLGLLP